MKRFNREVLEVDKAEGKVQLITGKVQLITFKVALKSKDFVVALAKRPLGSMAKMPLKA